MAAKKKLMQGNEACAEGALYAGCKFYAGYPITPSTEVAEIMSVELPKRGGKFIQMEDEIASMAATIVGSLAGLKSLTATSGPGFSLKQEALGYACITEVPCVIINVMRAVIALTPAYVQEILDETVRAFNLSEKYRTPVIVLYDEIVGHMREPITIPEPGDLEVIDRAKPDCAPEDYKPYDDSMLIPPLAPFGEGYRFHVTGLNHSEDGFPTNNTEMIDINNRRIMQKIDDNVDDICKNDESMLDDVEIGIFAIGSTSRSAKFSMNRAREKGIKAGLLRPLTIWPFPEKAVDELAEKCKVIIVPELNLGQMVHEVKRVAAGRCEVVGIHRVDGEPIKPAQITELIEKYS